MISERENYPAMCVYAGFNFYQLYYFVQFQINISFIINLYVSINFIHGR